MIAQVVYFLCAATSLVCVILLFRAYKSSGVRLLFWSTVCFAGFTVTNVLLFMDLIIVPEINLIFWRSTAALIGAAALLFGLIWEIQ